LGLEVIEMDVRVVNNTEASRYEAYVGPELAGFSEYRVRPDAIVFTHTEIDDAFEGKGVGTAVARGALEDVRAHGDVIVPLCPFIAAFIRRHEEFHDLVAARYRREFDAATAEP
jgi:predicted GNAT family acetyltransferase